jgi:hypothetical protein
MSSEFETYRLDISVHNFRSVMEIQQPTCHIVNLQL